MILDNLRDVHSRVNAVLKRLGRPADSVAVIGVTKFADVDSIKQALKGGLTDIGENKVQEGLKKFSILTDEFSGIRKHMLGHLQTNKTKQALQLFDVIQSVDSFKLAQEIEKQANHLDLTAKIFVQVNTAGEEQKFGIKPEETFALLKAIEGYSRVNVLGLMAIAPFTDDKAVVRRCFRDLKIIYDKAQAEFSGACNIKMQYLSMGMTDDFEIALEEGSNMVRVGRAIFN